MYGSRGLKEKRIKRRREVKKKRKKGKKEKVIKAIQGASNHGQIKMLRGKSFTRSRGILQFFALSEILMLTRRESYASY